MLTEAQVAIGIANSLTGYIAHVQGSFSCRHCELTQELADALRAAISHGAQAQREADAQLMEQTGKRIAAHDIRTAPLVGEAKEEGR